MFFKGDFIFLFYKLGGVNRRVLIVSSVNQHVGYFGRCLVTVLPASLSMTRCCKAESCSINASIVLRKRTKFKMNQNGCPRRNEAILEEDDCTASFVLPSARWGCEIVTF